ncbi:MAG TPA: DUF4234 domain-containing protein [Thermoanaerobaculia bacterium]|nr:DUF4234 domain-containing protein [Thermoanaerobaculia bacterium]
MADVPAASNIPGGKKTEDPNTVLIFGFLTCGVYCIYWQWLRVKEMNAYLGKEAVNPMFVFPGFICFPLFWYAGWLYANGLPEMQKKAGIQGKDEIALHALLLILLAPVGQYLVQQKLNEIWSKQG